MTEVGALIVEAERLGMRFDLRKNGEVHFVGPRGALQAQILNKLRAEKVTVRALLASREPAAPVCPCDLAERAALLETSCGIDRETATERALKSFGYDSFDEYVAASATNVRRVLDRLPAPKRTARYRLHSYSFNFLRVPYFGRALAMGWSIEELYGAVPDATFGTIRGLGLIPALAFPLWLHVLKGINEDHAVVRARSGKIHRLERFRSDMLEVHAWWEHRFIEVFH